MYANAEYDDTNLLIPHILMINNLLLFTLLNQSKTHQTTVVLISEIMLFVLHNISQGKECRVQATSGNPESNNLLMATVGDALGVYSCRSLKIIESLLFSTTSVASVRDVDIMIGIPVILIIHR